MSIQVGKSNGADWDILHGADWDNFWCSGTVFQSASIIAEPLRCHGNCSGSRDYYGKPNCSWLAAGYFKTIIAKIHLNNNKMD